VGARRALESLEAANAETPRALALRAAAAIRLGRTELAEAALTALEAADPAGAQAAVLRARATRLAGDAVAALAQLADTRSLEAELERAACLLARGQPAQAEQAVARALEAKGASPARVHAGWSDALLLQGRPLQAARASLRALEADAGDLASARRAIHLLLDLGRPLEAKAALARARKRQPELGELDVLWARVRAHAGDEVAVERLDPTPAAAVLAADLAAARGEPQAPAGEHPWVVAARARAEPGADLTALGELISDAPRDRPPDPGLARALRDLGWARLGAKDPAGAAAAARAALPGSPTNLDACLLLALAAGDEAAREGLRRAFDGALEQLGGPLGRGLFLARSARFRGSPAEAELAARLLLTARLASPPLPPLLEELERLAPLVDDEALRTALESAAAEAPPQGTAELLPWAELVPQVAPPPTLTPAQRKQVNQLARDSSVAENRDRFDDAEEAAEKALALDPYQPTAIHNLGRARCKRDGRLPENRLIYLRFLELKPGWTFDWIVETVRDWKEDHRWGAIDTPAKEAAQLLAKDDGPPHHHVPWIYDRYLGSIFPGQTKPSYTPGTDPEEVIARLDRTLARAPLLGGLLFVRAHLLSQLRRWEEVDRELATIDALLGDNRDRAGEVMTHWDLLYRLWINGPRVERAIRLMEKLRVYRYGRSQQTVGQILHKRVAAVKVMFQDSTDMAELLETSEYEAFMAFLQSKGGG
jgi:tetratricopeptide (TPR) repeat protein